MDTEEFPISEQEWMAVVEDDDELLTSPDDARSYYRTNGAPERQFGVKWSWNYAMLWYGNGAISVKNPDDETIAKMVQIANKLKARVLGEEDEEYK